MSKLLSVFFTLLFIPIIVSSQDKSKLEKDKLYYINQIKLTNDLLDKTKSNRKQSLRELQIIDKRISLRNKLISEIESEIYEIDDKIEENNVTIGSLQDDLEKKKKEYEQLIVLAYKKNSRYNDIIYILGARDINESYKRLRYIRYLSDYRKKQADVIEEIKNVLKEKTLELEIKREEKQILLMQRREENSILITEVHKKKDVIYELTKKEKELKRNIDKKEKVLKELETQIRAIIEAEAKKSSSGNLYERLTPRERIISNDFAKNKGSLPWPTLQGVVTSNFGEHNHPVLKGVKIRNNGIDIATTKDAEIRNVFNGVISRIVAIPGGNYAVIIRHGNYFTVYQNVVKVRVKQGDPIKIKEPIGQIFTENGEKSGTLQFQIWRENVKLNPEDWIVK